MSVILQTNTGNVDDVVIAGESKKRSCRLMWADDSRVKAEPTRVGVSCRRLQFLRRYAPNATMRCAGPSLVKSQGTGRQT